ncbi:MAG: ABC transporter substrate-binding protein [Oscillospiraceae bacterium]|nr:ABC transporter substrate-binding protein [Oscillospiraceae bacterium]
MKKLLALCLAAAMTATLFAGCGSSATESGSSTDGAESSSVSVDTEALSQTSWEDSLIRVGIDLDPGTLGPFETNNTGRKETLYEVYESLAMYQGRGGEVKGILAKNWYEESDNVYIVELYDYITDSNGNQITADDVLFSFDEGLTTYKRYLKYLENIEKVDEYTVRLELNSNDVATLENILCDCWIVDQESYEASGDGMALEPVGTGPYAVVDYVEGSKLTMEARDDYWQTDESALVDYQFRNVKTIEFVVITESAQQSIGLETGSVDVISAMPYSGAARLIDDDNYNVTTNVDYNTRTLFFNCNEESICSNLALRQAILYAFDSQGIMDGSVDGYGEVAYCFGHEAYPDISTSWDDGDYYAYDLDKAKELLEEAGYSDGCTVRLLTNTNEINGKIASIMQGYLAQVGIDLQILQYEETLAKTYMRDFTMFDIYLVYAGAPYYMVNGWNEKLSNTMYDNGLNYCGINDTTLEGLLQVALDSDTNTEETMTELYNYITDNAYVYGIFNPYLFTVSNKTVTSVSVNRDNWMLPGCNTYVWND